MSLLESFEANAFESSKSLFFALPGVNGGFITLCLVSTMWGYQWEMYVVHMLHRCDKYSSLFPRN